MKAHLIARVSTEDQIDALPAQVLRIKQYAEKQGYDFILHEIQESAYSGDRRQIMEVVEQIQRQSIKEPLIVVFDKVDRLTRDPTSDVYIILRRLALSGNIELHFAHDGITLSKTSPASIKTMLGFSVSSAEYYSAAISDNVKRRQAQMLHDGIWPSAPPFGYSSRQISKGSKWLEPNEHAHIVTESFEMYASGLTTLGLLKKHWKQRYGVDAALSRVEKVLKNPFYYGEMRWNKRHYDHNYAPLITRKTFDLVQEKLSGYPAKPHRWAGLPFAYRGLIFCDECGCKVTFEIKKKKYVYGHCTQSKYKHDAVYVSEAKISDQLIKSIERIHIPDDVLMQLQEYIKDLEKDSIDRIDKKRQLISQEIKRQESRLKILYEDRLDQKISNEIYDQKSNEIAAIIKRHQEDLQNIELLDSRQLSDYSYLLELANKAPKLFKKADYQEKRELLSEIYSNLCLNKDLLRWKYKRPYSLMAFCNEKSTWQGH